ncbi:hypothetical protein [Lysobacter brunescens]|uniref:Uncharacterized protein n=1 Tax=Lysobacter brunescens TaxID=262323 RepID=A0ABW2YF74_9GAMM
MPAYFVCYDLKKQGQDYAHLKSQLQQFHPHMQIQQSVWLIHSLASTEAVKNHLGAFVDSNDSLIVIQASEAKTQGLSFLEDYNIQVILKR